MAIPEPFHSQDPQRGGISKAALALQMEIDGLIDVIENLNFIKANDPEYLKNAAEQIIKLSKIVNKS